ncbi:PAS domain S-box protein [Methylobacterium durans]|uniref:Helix-turn-helix transcriptional regulator n=1 Tax=Methylobacterium durans TaxID=2202825 RepID=A0A2U8W2X7_9HYPH|nr:PAS domain S-box protein [Methylobacterium durans]AWN39626.1 helix-turn-helix transcriptional regulator [Methylobacterium durans]
MTDGVDRSELRQIVAGLTDGVILVEDDGRIAWANDAALAMHGAGDLGALGDSVGGYRSRFRLRYRDGAAPAAWPLERLVAGETFRDEVVDLASVAEPDLAFVHSLRSLVVTDAGGDPSCRALILRDVTAQYEAEERFERTFSANPAPAVICRLSDLRHVKVNAGFLEMTGHLRDAVVGRSVYEVDVLAGARQRELAIERLHAGRTIPQMEARLELPDGGSRFVIVAGQPIEMGDEPCMLFTFADLELRRKAETALRQSEERLEKAFRLTPVPTLLLRVSDRAVTGINAAFTRVFGYGEDAVIGATPIRFGLFSRDAARELFEGMVERTEVASGFETCLRHRDGEELDSLVAAERIAIGDDAFLLVVLQDITDRKRNERELFSAIEAVMADTSWFSRGLIEKLAGLRHPGRRGDGAVLNLTLRERQMLELICTGFGDEAISRRLGLSRNTVRNHTAALYRKLGLHKRSEVIVWGRNNGFPSAPTG